MPRLPYKSVEIVRLQYTQFQHVCQLLHCIFMKTNPVNYIKVLSNYKQLTF